MGTNLTYYDIDLPSDNLRLGFLIYGWIVTPFNLVLYYISMQIIAQHSPKAMGAYKWYMVWSITNNVMLNTFLASFEPECLSLNFELLARGVVEYLNMPFLGPVLRILFYHFFEMNAYITICRFLFRYAQTTGQIRLLHVLSHKNFFSFLNFLFMFLLAKSFWTNRFMWGDGDAYKNNFPNDNPEVKEYIMGLTVLIGRPTKIDFIFLYGVFPSTLFIGSFCTYQCYRFKKNATWLSSRTLHMYRLLIHGLVIEQLAEFLWVLLPLTITHVAMKPRQRPLGFYLMFRLCYLYPTFSMAFTLLFYRRYREAMKILITRICSNSPIVALQGSSVGTSSHIKTVFT